MSSVGLSPTSASQTSVDWSNINGVFGPDGSPAVGNPGSGVTTGVLSFDTFPSNQIPPGSTIDGIQFGGHAWSLSPNTVFCFSIACVINGIASSNLDNSSVLGTAVGSSLSWGGPTSFPAGLSGVTAADINTGSISGSVQFQGPGGNPGMSQIKASAWGLTIWYTPALDPLPCVVFAQPSRRPVKMVPYR